MGKFKVKTNINILTKLTVLLEDIGISNMFNQKTVKIQEILPKIANSILKEGKLIEFCQIVTEDDKEDFGKLEMVEVNQIINDFFTDLYKSMPEHWKEYIKKAFEGITKMGTQFLKQSMKIQDSGQEEQMAEIPEGESPQE